MQVNRFRCISPRFICLSHPRPALLSHVAYVQRPLPLQASDFTQPNFKQIWQVGADLCNRKAGEGGHQPPCLPWMTETSERSWLVAKDKNCILLLKGGKRAEAACTFCPTGNNLADSISLQHLSQTHDLPGRLSGPSPLPASSCFPAYSFSFYQAAIVSPACIIRMICHCCFVYLRSAHICH